MEKAASGDKGLKESSNVTENKSFIMQDHYTTGKNTRRRKRKHQIRHCDICQKVRKMVEIERNIRSQ